MTTTGQAATYAQTAQASYATGLNPNADNTAAFRNTAGMSQSQAEQFNATWNVLSQSAPSLDGFSAVLLENRITHEKVLAIAGTDPLDPGDLLTGIANIAVVGHIAGMPQYGSLTALDIDLNPASAVTNEEVFACAA